MGNVANITATKFPKQGTNLGRPVRLIFHYNSDESVEAVIVRDDIEEPFISLFKTKDDRYILAGECQYSFLLPR